MRVNTVTVNLGFLTMKVRDLFEAPLADYKVLGSKSKKETMSKENLKKAGDPKILKSLTKKLAGVDMNVYLYLVNEKKKRNWDGVDGKYSKQSVNPSFYRRTDPQELAELYGDKIASKIKHDENGVTLIFWAFDEFPLSSWAILHDLVHGITLSEKSSERVFTKAERMIEAVILRAKEKFAPEHWEITGKPMYKILPYLGTMKSAEKDLHERPEEFTTELMTQWLNDKKVSLTASEVADSKELREYLQAELDKLAPKLEKLFLQLLNDSKGKMYFTSG